MKIPEFLYSLFWEYEPENVDTVENAHLIMGRIMERGPWASMVWLLNTYSREQLANFLEKRGDRVLLPRELNYWALICGISPDKRKELINSAKKNQYDWSKRYSS